MKLVSMQLENIRSHIKTVIHFVDGFNCLVGGLGQGKSTILYAFDFVLFGDPLGRSYDYLLREDTKEGKVTAVFVHNGKTYRLTRALQRGDNSISQDTDQLKFYRENTLIAENKNDAVAEELKALTGLDKNIFREVVWVRQEHLKELLDITPRQRQKKLDELFGLSDYELAWSGLQMYQKIYDVEKSVLERDADIIRIDKLEADYINTVEEFSSVTAQLEDSKEKLVHAESALHNASVCIEGLEELRKTTEELQRKEIRLQTNIVNIKQRCRELADQNETSKKRLDDLKKLLKQMETQKNTQQDALQEIGWDPDEPIEDLKDHLSVVEDQIRTLSGEQEATRREMEKSITNISSIMTENKCPQCLQELTKDYKKSLKENLQKEQVEHQRMLSELQRSLDEQKNLHTSVYRAVQNLQQLLPRIEDITKQAMEKQESLYKFSAEIEKALEDENSLQQQLGETRKEIDKFDVSELENARKLRDFAFTKYSKAKYELENLMRKKKDLASRVDELKERLDNVQNKVERKEKIDKLIEIIDRIRIAYRSIQPKLRKELVKYLQSTVQQMLDSLAGDAGSPLSVRIDESYSPFVSSEVGYEREVTNLSGGERTLLAFAYRIGLGQLIMQSRTGHGLYMLLLDEPTESLGREDGSVERLAEAVSRLKAIEQIIAVTHNESFAEKAEHVIRIEKEAGASKIFIEK